MRAYIFLFTFIAALAGSIHNTNAQDRGARSERRAEMQARQTERLIKDLKLTDEQKPKFEAIYKRYLEELSAVRAEDRDERSEAGTKDKDLTDAEATARLNKIFETQADQIQKSQLRLDIQKKYCAELSSLLTPQQLVRVFRPRNLQRQGGNRQGGQGGRGGFGGQRNGGFGGGGGFGGPRGEF